jgi:hypothetical protein
MASFLTRVELYGSPTSADYLKLHEEMEKRQFSRTIKGDDGKTYHLPTAEYHSYSSTLDAAGVRNLAVDAAKAVGYVSWPGTATSKDCGVLTAEWNRLSWIGLKAV